MNQRLLRLRNATMSFIALGLIATSTMTLAEDLAEESKVPKNSFLKSGGSIPGEYIVVLDESNPELAAVGGLDATIAQHTHRHGASLRHTYRHSIKGFSIKATEAQARKIAAEPGVAYVVENGVARINATQANPTWGLDRVDQRHLPLNSTYNYTLTGANVHAYVIDTGINISHTDLGGRATADYSNVDDGNGHIDCHGHGTHVAGTIGSNTYGVAKAVRLHAVRVMDCSGAGWYSDIIAGIDWVTAHAVRPAVANMSLGGLKNQALNDAVARSMKAGIVHVVAAGNDASDACDYSPASAPKALTVSAISQTDERSGFANYGKCVDVFAPGEYIDSLWMYDNASTVMSGTSMAAPHVAGIVANYLQSNPSASADAAVDAVMSQVTFGKVSGVGKGSPNHLITSIPTDVRALYRYRHSTAPVRYYRTSWQALSAGSDTWIYEGIMGYLSPVARNNTAPLHQYTNRGNGDHFYTTNWAELGNGSGAWAYNGVIGHCPSNQASNTTPLYRYYNPNLGQHLYTNVWTELQGGQNGWVYQGIACHVYATP